MSVNPSETIIVTGGAGGIGSATVRKYASLGKRVVIGDINIDSSEKLVSQLGDNVFSLPLDVLSYDSIKSFSEAVRERFGTVAHLVGIAGGAHPKEGVGTSLEELEPEIISYEVDWNLKSHLYLIREFLPLLKVDPSDNISITLISSINAFISFGQAAYSSSKAGMVGIVRSTANELGRYGIRINAVLPGSTPTTESAKFLGGIFEELREASSLKRLSTPDEVANAIYAFTHLMTSVTGQYLAVDAGQSIAYPYKKY